MTMGQYIYRWFFSGLLTNLNLGLRGDWNNEEFKQLHF